MRSSRILVLPLVVVAVWIGTSFVRPVGDSGRLIAFTPYAPPSGEVCEWDVADAAYAPQSGAAIAPVIGLRRGNDIGRAPIRTVQDPFAVFSSVYVDAARNEVVFTDENKFRIMVFDRMTNTPPTAAS
jgi:hypothetical protein